MKLHIILLTYHLYVYMFLDISLVSVVFPNTLKFSFLFFASSSQTVCVWKLVKNRWIIENVCVLKHRSGSRGAILHNYCVGWCEIVSILDWVSIHLFTTFHELCYIEDGNSIIVYCDWSPIPPPPKRVILLEENTQYPGSGEWKLPLTVFIAKWMCAPHIRRITYKLRKVQTKISKFSSSFIRPSMNNQSEAH